MDAGIVVAIVSGCCVIIAGITKWSPKSAPPTNGNRPVTQSECEARMDATGIEIKAVGKQVDTLHGFTKEGFNRIEKAVERLREDD